jgi:hypothetical protein
MAGYWLKLYTEILDDPKYHRLSDTAKLGMVELMVVAKKSGTNGDLPEIEDICFYTRRAKEWWIPVIDELKSISFLVENGSNEKIRKFEERQAPADGAERTRMSRVAKQHTEYTCNDPVTKVSQSVTENRLKIKDSEKSREEIDSAPAPISINQTGDPFTTQVFSTVTGMTAIPGGDLPKVLPAIDALRAKYPTVDKLTAYLTPYYQYWQTKKTKDGRPFSKSNCAWLYDWAVAGDPLPTDKKPPSAKPDPDCPVCGGMGLYRKDLDVHDPNFGKLTKCECVKVREEVDA